MTNPKSTTGPKPPARRKPSKFAGAGKSTTQVTAAETAQEAAEEAAEKAQETSAPPLEGNHPGTPPTAAQAGTEPESSTAPAAEGVDKAAAPEEPAPEAPPVAAPEPAAPPEAPPVAAPPENSPEATGTELAIPESKAWVFSDPQNVPVPDLNSVTRRRQAPSNMNPVQYRRLGKMLDDDLLLVVKASELLRERQWTLSMTTQILREAGFPEEDMDERAEKAGWQKPPKP